MNKKRLILFVILLVIIGGAITGFYIYSNKSKSLKTQPPKTSVTTTNTGYQMRGNVKEVKTDSLVIDGTILQPSQSQSTSQLEKEFKVTPKTVLKNNQIVITAQQAKSGKSFAPQTNFLTGKFSDFAKGTYIAKIVTSENLLTEQTVDASEIDYYTYDIQTTK